MCLRDKKVLVIRELFTLFFVVSVFLGLSAKQVSAADWTGEYWNLSAFSGASPAFPSGVPTLTRTDSTINFDWGMGSPDSSINVDDFATRWTKTLDMAGGSYTFTTNSDDGVRFYMDGNLLLSSWIDQAPAVNSVTTTVTAGSHTLKVEYYENGGGAVIQFSYDSPPGVSSFSPATGATGVVPTSNLVVTFSENITAVSGKNIAIKKTEDDTTVETISANDTGKVSVSGAIATINPATVLSDLTGYYVLIDSGAFKDSANKIFAGISAKTDWAFTTADTSAPLVSILTPANSATSVAPSANLVLAFNENITAVAGKNITIKKKSDVSDVEVISANDTGKVTVSGNTASINPATVLDDLTQYYVLTDSGAFKDTANNSFAGIADSTVWGFTTADSTAPTAVALVPVSGSLGVTLGANLSIEFNEPIVVGAGNVRIFAKNSDVEIATIDVTGAGVTNNGSGIIAINPSADLQYQTDYYVKIDGTAFVDTASNAYAGISDKTTWVFTTVVAPAVVLDGNNGSGDKQENERPDPVQSLASFENKAVSSTGEVPKIEVVTGEKFVLKIKAPDSDQVKSVVVKIDNKAYRLVLDKNDPKNPFFAIKLLLDKPGKYSYSAVTDYGSTVRRSKGVVLVGEKKKEIVATPKPRVVVKKEKTKIAVDKPTAVSLNKTESVTGKNLVAIPQSAPKTVKEVVSKISWFNRTVSKISSASRVVTGFVSGSGNKIVSLFEKKPAHIYRTVTVKLATAEGVPLVGATVTLFSDPKTSVSNQDGKAEFHDIEAGKHKLQIDYQGYKSKQSLEITEPVTEVTINVTANLNKGWRFLGF
jgi:hypothetical protein